MERGNVVLGFVIPSVQRGIFQPPIERLLTGSCSLPTADRLVRLVLTSPPVPLSMNGEGERGIGICHPERSARDLPAACRTPSHRFVLTSDCRPPCPPCPDLTPRPPLHVWRGGIGRMGVLARIQQQTTEARRTRREQDGQGGQGRTWRTKPGRTRRSRRTRRSLTSVPPPVRPSARPPEAVPVHRLPFTVHALPIRFPPSPGTCSTHSPTASAPAYGSPGRTHAASRPRSPRSVPGWWRR